MSSTSLISLVLGLLSRRCQPRHDAPAHGVPVKRQMAPVSWSW
ncbi:MAG TPA: hypothetical protein VGB98_04570 [Pyrinomonadaceae bacterium]